LTLPLIAAGGSSVMMTCVTGGVPLRISYEVSRAERAREANLIEPRDLIGGMPSGATA